MTVLQYLQLQPVDPQDDGTTSALDAYQQDETIDLSQDIDGESLIRSLDAIVSDLHESDPATTSQ